MPEHVPFLARWRGAVLAARPRPNARVGIPAIRLVGLTLSTHMDAGGGSCFPGLPLLASETGLERATVSRAVNELVAAGLLFSKRTGRSNRYHAILPEPVDNPVESVDKPVDFHVETGSDATSDLASDHVGSGLMPPEDVQGGRTPSRTKERDLLLLNGGNLLEPVQDVAALVAESLGAIT